GGQRRVHGLTYAIGIGTHRANLGHSVFGPGIVQYLRLSQHGFFVEQWVTTPTCKLAQPTQVFGDLQFCRPPSINCGEETLIGGPPLIVPAKAILTMAAEPLMHPASYRSPGAKESNNYQNVFPIHADEPSPNSNIGSGPEPGEGARLADGTDAQRAER